MPSASTTCSIMVCQSHRIEQPCGRSAGSWPAVDILVRGDSHYGRPEAMAWCERNRVGYIFGLAGNKVLLGRVADLAEEVAIRRVARRGR